MSSTAQTLETSAAAAAYHGLSARNLLLCLVGLYAASNSITAQQASVTAAANRYAALSDRQLDECILEAVQGSGGLPTPSITSPISGEIRFGFISPDPVSWVVQLSANGTTGWTTFSIVSGSLIFTSATSGQYCRVQGVDGGNNPTTNYSNVILVT